MDRLRALARGAASTAVGIVGGDAGVGKTRLVRNLADELEAAGAIVLTGGCLDLGDTAPAFSPLPEALGGLARRDVAPPPAPAEVTLLAPALPGDHTTPRDGTRLRIFQAILGYLRSVADVAPVVLVLEDLHWSDSSTRELVAFAARTLEPGPVTLIASYRSDDLHRRHPLRSTLAELDRAGTVEHIQVAPLSRAETGELLAALSSTPPTSHEIDRVHTRSEGNPFYVEELAAADPEGVSVPASLADLLLVRVDRLPPRQRAVLDAAAVVGRDVDHAVLAAITDDDELDDHVRALVETGLLVIRHADRPLLSFRHALLHEAVHDQLLPWDRTALHSRVAEVLSADPTGAGRGGMAALAVHQEAAGDPAAALAARVGAAREAAVARTYDEAAHHAEAAMRLWSRTTDPEQVAGIDEVDLVRLAAEWHSITGRPRDAERLGMRVLDLLPSDTTDVERAVALERLARYRWVMGEEHHGYATYQEAADVLPDDAPDRAAGRVLAGLAQGHSLHDRPAEAVALAEQALAHARAAADRAVEGHVLNTLGLSSVALGDPHGVELIAASLEIALERADPDDVLRGHVNLSNVLWQLGRSREAVAAADAGVVAAQEYGSRPYELVLHGNALQAALNAGDVDAALARTAGIGEAELSGQWMRGAAAALAMCTGDLAVARDRLRGIDLSTTTLALARDGDTVVTTMLELLWWEGRLDEAAAGVRTLLDRLDGADPPGWWPRLAAVALRTLADIDAEPEAGLRDHLLAGVERSGSTARVARPGREGWVALAELEHARATGRDDLDGWVRTAEALAIEAELPHLEPYARWRAAERAVQDGDGSAAGLARLAAETSERARAAHVAERVRSLSAAARLDPAADTPGSPAPPPVVGGPLSSLTAREREVLLLVAEGRTNGEIGDALFISPKTASVHVSNILRKLDVTNRVEAAMVALNAGLVADD